MKLDQLLEIVGSNVINGELSSPYPEVLNDTLFYNSKGLTTLKGFPRHVKNHFGCIGNNKLTSLEGGPKIVDGYFNCEACDLTSLKGAPETVGESFGCSNNKLTSFEHCPSKIGGGFHIVNNKLTSLEGIHKHLKKMNGGLHADNNPITSHILGVFLISGCTMVYIDNQIVQKIVNKNLYDKGRDGLIDCQNELIEAGYEDFAQI